MELRVLQYYLAVAKEESISRAAESLHISQPTLSRQIRDMEEQLGTQLFIRGNRKITLTEEGILLRQRAEEILGLVQKTEEEIHRTEQEISGNVQIGAGESDGMRYLIKAAKKVQINHPHVHFHLVSGDKTTVTEGIDRGLLDFGIVFERGNSTKYECLPLPYKEQFGILLPSNDPLLKKDKILPQDLWDKPLIVSRQSLQNKRLSDILQRPAEKLNIVATYNLLFNASLMVQEGMGYAVCFDKIVYVDKNSHLQFYPLTPQPNIPMFVIWKKGRIFSRAAEMFLQQLQDMCK